jgi:peptidoglycan/xylan/chitin deacetylase (PgdA/CDA1 family)
MNALPTPDNKGIFSEIRNSPLFFLPLILLGGYALASLAYTLFMKSDGWSDRLQSPAAAQVTGANLNPDSNDPQRLNATSPGLNPDYPSQITSAVNIASADIYLLNSKKTHDYFASTGGNYKLILDQWHYYFQNRGVKYLDIHDDDLKSDLNPGILILPSAVVLDSDELAAIQAFEKKGGSVLATWATGARNGTAQWVGYDFLHDQFGIKVSGEIAAQENEKFLDVSGESPVAFSLPAGTEIWLGLDEIHERPLRVSGGDNVAGRFMDAVRTPEGGTANEAIVYTEAGTSRRIYFGFSESSWRFDQANIYKLLDDMLNWLHRRPDDYLANWPYPYRSAQILEMDTEQGYPNALNFANLLNSNGFKGTFYSLTSVASQYPDVVRQLELKHEIAYHGDVHVAFKGQPGETQSKRLDTMQQELRPLVRMPSALRGFRPPYELSDQVVESLLFKKGFGHILANSENTGAMLPFLSLSSPKDFRTGLIVLPRTQRDDMNFAKEGLNSQDMAKIMGEDFDQTREFGGLGVLSVHSQSFETDSPVANATAQFLAHIKASGKKTWVAPGGTIESWWRERALIKSSLTGEPKRMLLSVTVEDPGVHWKTSIVISNPIKGLQPEIKITKVGMALPQTVPLDAYRTAIVFPPLEPGHYSYYLSY